jgi:hypothetical protein
MELRKLNSEPLSWQFCTQNCQLKDSISPSEFLSITYREYAFNLIQ